MTLREKLLPHYIKYNNSVKFLKESYLEKRFGENIITEIIQATQFIPEDRIFTERVYCIVTDLHSIPVCKICGKQVQIRSNPTTNGTRYPDFCSHKCSAMCSTTQDKKKATNLEKYGTTNVLSSNYVKNIREEVLLKKYGATNFFKTEQYKKDKPLYNKPNYEQIGKQIIDTTYDKIKEKFKDKLELLFTKDEYKGCGYDIEYKWKCKVCSSVFTHWYHNGWLPKCPNCNPGTDIENIVSNILTKNNTTFTRGSKSILDNYKQLDFYIPEYKLAIEVHGLFWHQETDKINRKYHINKLKECLDKDIKLVQIFADEIYHKQSIVESRISHYLHLDSIKVYGRKCEVKEINNDISMHFFNETHIQGGFQSKYNYGLYYKDTLISCISFNPGRDCTGNSNKKDEYELIRFSTLPNYQIIGGFSKLLQHFIRNIKPTKITTFCDRRWSEGDFYIKCGFKFLYNTDPNYWYISKDYKSRMHRYGFQKHKLNNILENFDPKLTEFENMKNNGYGRIWDCGNKKFELDLTINNQTTT